MEINLVLFFSKYKNIWPGNCSLMSRNEWLRQLCVYRLDVTRFISFEGIVLDRKWFCATQEEGVYSILNPPLLSTSGIRMKIFRLGHGLNWVHHKCFSNYRYWDCTRCVEIVSLSQWTCSGDSKLSAINSPSFPKDVLCVVVGTNGL